MTKGSLILIGAALAGIVLIILLSGIRFIPNTRIGIAQTLATEEQAIQ